MKKILTLEEQIAELGPASDVGAFKGSEDGRCEAFKYDDPHRHARCARKAIGEYHVKGQGPASLCGNHATRWNVAF